MKVVAGEGVDKLELQVVGVVVDLDSLFVAVVGTVIMLQRKHLMSASDPFCDKKIKDIPWYENAADPPATNEFFLA